MREGKRVDYPLVICVSFLVLFGIVMIYSASNYTAAADMNDPLFFAKKQLIGALLGGGGMFFFSRFSYQKLFRFRIVGVILSVLLLLLVFVPGIGVENYGAKRWIGFGGLTIQPSEIAKFAFVLFAAAYMSKNFDNIVSLRGNFPIILVGGTLCLLILAEPNLSITICLGLTLLVMLFVGGMKLKWFGLLFAGALAMIPVLIALEPYRLARLAAFLDPWASPQGEGYQLIQSLYALGSGGLFGTGLFTSRQALRFLPFGESDFIFSIIGEETGLFGCLAVMGIFLAVIYRGIRIARSAPDRFGCYLASGITSIIAIQFLINVAVVTGSIPPTGLPLPFVSAGSTSLVVFLCAVGVLLNIGRSSLNSTKDGENP